MEQVDLYPDPEVETIKQEIDVLVEFAILDLIDFRGVAFIIASNPISNCFSSISNDFTKMYK